MTLDSSTVMLGEYQCWLLQKEYYHLVPLSGEPPSCLRGCCEVHKHNTQLYQCWWCHTGSNRSGQQLWQERALLPLLPPSDHVIMITAIRWDKAAAKSKVKSRCFWFLICYTICRERASAWTLVTLALQGLCTLWQAFNQHLCSDFSILERYKI